MDGEQPVAEEQPPVDAQAAGGLDVSDEDEEQEGPPQEVLDADLLKACRENNTEAVIKALETNANPLYEKDGWNPLLWAACNGNEEIVRKLV